MVIDIDTRHDPLFESRRLAMHAALYVTVLLSQNGTLVLNAAAAAAAARGISLLVMGDQECA